MENRVRLPFVTKLVSLFLLAVAVPLGLILAELELLSAAQVAWILAGLLAGVVLLFVFSYRLGRELEEVRDRLRRWTPGTELEPLPELREDELGEVVAAINEVGERFTERESSLARQAEAESLKTVGSVLAHEIRNLSFRLTSLTENLESHHDDPQFRKMAVRSLADTAQQMERIVDRFKHYAQERMVRLPMDVNSLLDNALGRLQVYALDNFTVYKDYADLPPVVGDPFYLETAFYNIIENAVEAMEGGGELVVRTRAVESNSHEPQVVVEIADDGGGMTAEFVRQELFAPFSTNKSGGMGLGMYTTRRIVGFHDGDILVDSVPNEGTTFTVVLPASEA